MVTLACATSQLSGGLLPWKAYMPGRSRTAELARSDFEEHAMSSLPVRVIALTLAIQAASAWTTAIPCEGQEAKQFPAEPTRTGKERLGGKASDEQRIDNCKVPLELRGPKPRPDDCPDAASARPQR
jgi:hypothetical protein